jgi:hypothetical protein
VEAVAGAIGVGSIRASRSPVVEDGPYGCSRMSRAAVPNRSPGRPFVIRRNWKRASEKTERRVSMQAKTIALALYAPLMRPANEGSMSSVFAPGCVWLRPSG